MDPTLCTFNPDMSMITTVINLAKKFIRENVFIHLNSVEKFLASRE